MSGIYFHIPFCKVKCSYCDFYKTTNNSKIEELVKAIRLELWLRRDYLQDDKIETIYFGGGTPSLLTPDQLESIILACHSVFKVQNNAEITIEANPDDLSTDYLKAVKKVGVNRLSIGIQSFAQTDLKLMKRRHNPKQAQNAVLFARAAGFNNISVDLIYGVPGMSQKQWEENLKKVFELDVEHLSAYHLTYHKGTKLYDDLHKGLLNEIEENDSIKQFNTLVEYAGKYGFIHYELSNFAKTGFYSQHNSSYWKQVDYLGLGPSAHSYNKTSRQWNIASLTLYLEALKNKKIPAEKEELTQKDRFNDYIITSLRTTWGIDLKHVEAEFGETFREQLVKTAVKYTNSKQLVIENEHLLLEHDGKMVSDAIMADLMI